MLDRLANWFGIRVTAGVPGLLRRGAPVALGAVLFAAIGLAWPLSGAPPPPASASSPAIAPDVSAADRELDDFLAMARWGIPAYDAEKARREAEAARLAAEAAAAGGLNIVLARLGVIGITTTVDSRAVLLTKPDGAGERLAVGGTLPDGRVLVSVTANSVVLEDAGGGREELLLFPRHGEAVDAGEAPADGEGVP